MDQRASGRPPRASRLNPAERRARLLACAIRVFARDGLGQGRHARVAAEARVSVPTVFVYFPTREALSFAVLDEVARFILQDVVAPLQSTPGAVPDRLCATAVAFADSIDTHPDHARVWLDWSTALRADVWPRYLEFQERVIGLLKPTLEQGCRDGTLDPDLDCDDAARLLVGSAHMIAQMKFTGRDAGRVRHFVETIVGGFRARAAPLRPGPVSAEREQHEEQGEGEGEP